MLNTFTAKFILNLVHVSVKIMPMLIFSSLPLTKFKQIWQDTDWVLAMYEYNINFVIDAKFLFI